MPLAELVGDKIMIFTEFREKELVKQVPGVRWDNDAGAWWMRLSWAGCVQLRGVFGANLQVGDALANWAKADIANRIQPCMELRTAEDAPDLTIMSALYPFQRAGAKFLATARYALVADEMGLGKSVQSISALEVIGDAAYPALVVCGNSMKHTWADEFQKWAPQRQTVVIDGSAVKRRKQLAQLIEGEAQVGIINYEGLRAHTRLAAYPSVTLTDAEKEEKELNAIDIKSVIADEAHRAQDPRSKQTRALWYVSANADQRYALTGTPVEKSPVDLWTLMRFVAPDEYPVKGKTDNGPTGFLGRYAQGAMNVYGFQEIVGLKAETREELFKILDPRMIRRLKATVMPQLPPKTYQVRTVTMVPKQKKAYDGMREEMMAQLESGLLIASNPLVRMTRLLQFASCYGEMGEPVFEVKVDGKVVSTHSSLEEAQVVAGTMPGAEVKDATPLLLTEPSCKVDGIEEIADEIGEQQALVFAESSQLIDLAHARILKTGRNVGKITGAVAVPDRQLAVQAFQARQSSMLFMTLGAGGEGLSFPGVGITVFLQRSFRNLLNLQAEDRTHGIGRGIDGQSSLIIDLITEGTAEGRVHEIRKEKAEQLEAVVRDAETLKAWLKK